MQWFLNHPEDVLLGSPTEPAPIPISSPVGDSPVLDDSLLDPIVPPALQPRNSPVGINNMNSGYGNGVTHNSQPAAPIDDIQSVSESLSDEEASNFNPILSYVGDN